MALHIIQIISSTEDKENTNLKCYASRMSMYRSAAVSAPYMEETCRVKAKLLDTQKYNKLTQYLTYHHAIYIISNTEAKTISI